MYYCNKIIFLHNLQKKRDCNVGHGYACVGGSMCRENSVLTELILTFKQTN